MTGDSDTGHMARALELAARGRFTTDPNPRVGCVVVNDGAVVGEGWHQRAGEAHAEPVALAVAGQRARGATLYVTLEPCCHHGRTPPCTDAILAAGVARVVAAMQDPSDKVAGQGLAQLRAAGVEVDCGLLENEARALNPGFIKRMQTGLPYLRIKMAMSLDGRTAMADGESKWITGEDARRDVQRLRAASSAILTGIGTVQADDPAMTVRLDAAQLGVVEGPVRQPLRVVLDPLLEMSPTARILSPPGEVAVFCAEGRAAGSPLADRAELLEVPADGDRLDLTAVLRELARCEINEVLVESGATLTGCLLDAGLADELIVYIAPHLMGERGRPLFRLSGIDRMQDRFDVDITGIRAVGRDWRITAVPVPRD